eukprot:scaffold69502_cov67-Phaeocystis_antarctica.AAC.3
MGVRACTPTFKGLGSARDSPSTIASVPASTAGSSTASTASTASAATTASASASAVEVRGASEAAASESEAPTPRLMRRSTITAGRDTAEAVCSTIGSPPAGEWSSCHSLPAPTVEPSSWSEPCTTRSCTLPRNGTASIGSSSIRSSPSAAVHSASFRALGASAASDFLLSEFRFLLARAGSIVSSLFRLPAALFLLDPAISDGSRLLVERGRKDGSEKLGEKNRFAIRSHLPSYNFSYFLTERGEARCLPSSNPSRRVLAPSLAPSARTRSNSLHTCAQACYAIYKVHGSSGS